MTIYGTVYDKFDNNHDLRVYDRSVVFDMRSYYIVVVAYIYSDRCLYSYTK